MTAPLAVPGRAWCEPPKPGQLEKEGHDRSRAENPAAVMRAALDARLPLVKHPSHPYYFMVPGSQVFTIAPLH